MFTLNYYPCKWEDVKSNIQKPEKFWKITCSNIFKNIFAIGKSIDFFLKNLSILTLKKNFLKILLECEDIFEYEKILFLISFDDTQTLRLVNNISSKMITQIR